MSRFAIAVACTLTCTLAFPVAEAVACSVAEESLAESQTITDVPLQGLVPVYIYGASDGGAGTLVAKVYDSAEQLIAGTSSLENGRMIWQSDAPLEPGATYTMRATRFETQDAGEVQFITESTASTRTLSLSLNAGQATERRYDAVSLCCDDEVNSCGTPSCSALEFGYFPSVSVELETATLAPRYLVFEAAGTNLRGSSIQAFAESIPRAFANFSDYRDSYCFSVTARNLLDDETVTEEFCADAGQLIALDRESASPDACTGDSTIVDNDEDDDIFPSASSGGCAVGGTPGSLGLLVIGLALLGFRRRKSALGTR